MVVASPALRKSGDMDPLQFLIDDTRKDVDDLRLHQREIFKRLNDLEKRVAQFMVVAVFASLILPVIVEVIINS